MARIYLKKLTRDELINTLKLNVLSRFCDPKNQIDSIMDVKENNSSAGE